MNTRAAGLFVATMLAAAGCRQPEDSPQPRSQTQTPADSDEDASFPEAATTETETGDALSGEAAHTIPFADRTSMGYLLLLPPSADRPDAPTRAFLAGLVEQSFPDRRHDGEIDLLLTLIATKPHTTDAGTIDLDGLLETGEPETQTETETERDRNRGKILWMDAPRCLLSTLRCRSTHCLHNVFHFSSQQQRHCMSLF